MAKVVEESCPIRRTLPLYNPIVALGEATKELLSETLADVTSTATGTATGTKAPTSTAPAMNSVANAKEGSVLNFIFINSI